MSELIQTQRAQRNCRLCLLATVSALALAPNAFVWASAEIREAAPTVWIELGGQLQRDDGGQLPFAPNFATSEPRPDYETFSPTGSQHLPRYSFGGEGKITFRPEGSDWSFSASVLYGRSNRDKSYHGQRTYALTGTLQPTFPFSAHGYLFSDLRARHSESHAVLDFMAGRDVGLGVFGPHGEAMLDLGVRFAQFSSKSNISLRSMPQALSWKYVPFFQKSLPTAHQRSYFGTNSASRSFHGLGPAISWNASNVVAGHDDTADLTFDWGINAALLFGRQKAKVHHHTTGALHTGGMTQILTEILYTKRPPTSIRSRSVIVPNLGGFAGLSMKFPNGKVSFGYRADFFFGAMDGGIDTHKSYDRNFFGPYARIGIGL